MRLTRSLLLGAITLASAMPSAVAQDLPQATADDATGVGVLFVPPYTEEVMSLSALRSPCSIAPSGVEPTVSDPAAGTMAPLSAGITVSGCSLHGRTDFYRWNLGDVLLPLVGQPGQVIAVFDGAADASAEGNGTLSASLNVRLGDDSVDGNWHEIARARCSGDGCAGHTRNGPFIFAAELDALPATLWATFRSETHAEDATGHAEAIFEGSLKFVIVRPLD